MGNRSLRRTLTLVLASASLVTLACSRSGSGAGVNPRVAGLRLETIATRLEAPVHLIAPSRDPRLFVVEQPGRIRIIAGGKLLARPFIDLTARVGYGGERGLLSLAFHPQYATNGYFYLNYTDRNGDTQIERYQVSSDSNVADPASRAPILSVEQPYANHNGGHILFGPDGMLYIGMGDGGSAGDPNGNGQNLGTLLGKLLRIDVDHGVPYSIPKDNPLVGRVGARGEIWAWGLRNPWRLCFDATDQRLYIADVGQNQWEEVDVVTARGGYNFGWRTMEGNHCYRSSRCDRTGLTPPAVEYSHSQGCSVTGGLVYRGKGIPEIVGHYFYADYCEGWIRSFRYVDGQVTDSREWETGSPFPVSSFGQDAAGELYVLDHGGRVLKIVADH